ncbi:MAG: amidase family protein, partial [Rubrimonas sp.]
ADYLLAERLRRRLCERWAEVFATVDAVVGPTAPLTAWPTGQTEVTLGGRVESALAASWRFTYPWNLVGAPAVSVPCGFDDRGLPIGLQIAAAPFDDMTALRVAAAVEAQMGGPAPKAPLS